MFILGLVLLWIWNIIITSRDLNSTTINEAAIYFLKNSAINMISKSDLTTFSIWDIFYIQKDSVTKSIYILTWSTNSWSMYIDRHWYKVDDISTFKWYIYTQTWIILDIDNNLWVKNVLFDLTVKKIK